MFLHTVHLVLYPLCPPVLYESYSVSFLSHTRTLSSNNQAKKFKRENIANNFGCDILPIKRRIKMFPTWENFEKQGHFASFRFKTKTNVIKNRTSYLNLEHVNFSFTDYSIEKLICCTVALLLLFFCISLLCNKFRKMFVPALHSRPQTSQQILIVTD